MKYFFTFFGLFIFLTTMTQVFSQSYKLLFNENNVTFKYHFEKTGEKCNCEVFFGPYDTQEIYKENVKKYEGKVIRKYKLTATLHNGNSVAIRFDYMYMAEIRIRGVANPTICYGTVGWADLATDASDGTIQARSNDLINQTLKPGETKTFIKYGWIFPGDQEPVIDSWDVSPWEWIIPDEDDTKKDDFWSGKDKKKNDSKTSGEDDFWSGKNEKQTKKNNANDFWSGSGTSNEENFFKTNTKPIKSNQFIGEIESPTKYLTIKCRDHGEVDGDRVKIFLNKKVIKSNITLKSNYYTFEVQLKNGMNRIDFEALNQGTLGPNTAEFKIYDDKNKLISSKEWNILTGYTATLLIVSF